VAISPFLDDLFHPQCGVYTPMSVSAVRFRRLIAAARSVPHDPALVRAVKPILDLLRGRWSALRDDPADTDAAEDFNFDSASDDEVFALLERRLSGEE
jgi:hypothetical protein